VRLYTSVLDRAAQGFDLNRGSAKSTSSNITRSPDVLFIFECPCKRDHNSSSAVKGFAAVTMTSIVVCPTQLMQHPLTRFLTRFAVLVDLDNTVVDWDKEFTKRWIAAGNPQSDSDVIKARKHFEIELNFAKQQTEQVIKVGHLPLALDVDLRTTALDLIKSLSLSCCDMNGSDYMDADSRASGQTRSGQL
jgi:hypothetical protein